MSLTLSDMAHKLPPVHKRNKDTVIVLTPGEWIEYWYLLLEQSRQKYLLFGFPIIRHKGRDFQAITYRGVPVVQQPLAIEETGL